MSNSDQLNLNKELGLSNKQRIPCTASNLFKGFQLEIIIVAGLLVLFLIVNLATSSRFPTVWLDEVAYTDPAANLYFGNGFTSSAWLTGIQTKDEFWAGNMPLYPVILYHWIQLFGFGPVAVRSLSYVLMTASGLMLWLSAIKLNLVTSAWSRITLVLLILLGYGMGWNYRTGRPDSLTICLCAAAVLVYSIQPIWLRCCLLLCLGVFFSISGPQLLVYTAMLCCLLLIFLGKSFLKESVSLAIGLILGITFIYILYSTNEVGNDFILNMKAAKAITAGSIPKDPSLLMLLISATAITIYQIKIGNFRLRSPLLFGLTAGVCIPIGMKILGRFPTYYTWMAYIPLAVGVCSAMSKWRFNFKNPMKLLVLGSLLLTCSVGLPLQLASAAYYWNDRDYAKVESLVESNVRESDWVYCAHGAYYAAKKKASVVIVVSYSSKLLTPQDKEKISVLIIRPDQFERVANMLGGQWYSSGDGISPSKKSFLVFQDLFNKNKRLSDYVRHQNKLLSNYDLQVFRRKLVVTAQ